MIVGFKEMGGIVQVGIIAPSPLLRYALARLVEEVDSSVEVVCLEQWRQRGDLDLQGEALRLLLLDSYFLRYDERLVRELRHREGQLCVISVDWMGLGESCDGGIACDGRIVFGTAIGSVRELIEHALLCGEEGEEQPALSRREVEVLRLLVQGKTAKEIGNILCISAHTVTSHRKNLSAKLGIKSVAGMAIYAVYNGLVDITDVDGLEGEE